MTVVETLHFSFKAPDLLTARGLACRFDRHMHDTWSVIALTRGSAVLQSWRWRGTVEAGDVFFFNPFEVHMGDSVEHAVEYEVLYPSRRFMTDCCLPARGKAMFPMLLTGIVRRCAATEELLEALSSQTDAAARIEDSLRKVFERCTLDPAAPAADRIAAVDTACRIIGERYGAPLRTETLADLVGLHKSHFVRIFHRVTGIAPQTYLRQVRVAKARELICAGLGLSEAALAAGFCDQAHLNREFSKVYGVTPGRLSRDLHAARQ
jgi:AraC-like DNA-binding protein